MGDILNEAYGIVQCKECQWYKSCVTPMRISGEDIQRQMSSIPGNMMPPPDASLQSFFSNMSTAAQNFLLEGCPVFIERLRRSQELAQRIKELMRDWGKEEPAK